MSKVWSKGDPCLSPYSGDKKLYRGTIQKILRSPEGQILARVKFEGYSDEECEEIEVTKLQEVKLDEKIKEPAVKKKHTNSCTDNQTGGLFSPLLGDEASQRLKARFESDDEDDEIAVKSERLSSLLFRKQITAGCQKNMKGDRTQTSSQKIEKELSAKKSGLVEPHSASSGRRKMALNITGGQAKNENKELYTSKKLSDVSSIVDSHSVEEALRRHTPRPANNSASDDDEHAETSGFSDEDLEKPKFIFRPEAAKVPLILSPDGEHPVVQVPATLNQYLRDYQREGIKFLYDHYRHDRGAILGDDMGLGKTVQVIGFLSALLGKHGNRVDVMRQKPKFIRKLSDTVCVKNDAPSKGPFLIIGPGCVLYNWLEEFETWGYFSVRKFHGSDKAECLKDIKKGKVEIVVTTFETFREHMASLNTVRWDAVIVDEVHKIKDMKARTTQALRGIGSKRRFGLTGTALQNNLLEFWSILDWARPGCLGSQADFVHEFVRPIEEGQRHDANKRELASARKQKEKLSEVRKTMMIRRLKALIGDQLPKKDDNVVFCKLSHLQVSIYQTILKHPGMDLVIHGDDPCGCDNGEPQSKCCKQKTPDGHTVKSLRFTFMHLLLKTSNHVALLIPTQKTSEKQAKLSNQICEVALKEHPEFVTQTKEASFKTLSDPKYCGKMKVLQGLLKVFYKDHAKVLVFSYSTQVLDIIEQHLMSTGYEFRRIDGTVSSKKRMVVVREFNTDPNIFICLISTKAGGLGLNLTGANKVVIFDPNWNPTHDLQAQDRAYRIGQRQNVQVFRLVSAGTIEENMYLRQIYKQQLLNLTVEDENARRYFYAVQGNPKLKGEIFGIKNMFVLRTGESCLTRDIIKRNERVESGLAGFELAQYVPPVVQLEEDEEYEDVVQDTNTASDESDNVLAQFFSSEESDTDERAERADEGSLGDLSDTGEEISERATKRHNSNEDHGLGHQNDDDLDENSEVGNSVSREDAPGKTTNVRLPDISRGKVRPSQSRTGKGPLKKKRVRSTEHIQQYDQTLAGTFGDVSEVFDNCGVVHIHENVKVVGGSRAEDHMTRCAISDVFEHHQHSQELAAQCEPMQESADDIPVVPVKRGRSRKDPVEDHNTLRSVVIGKTKVLIGQTPKTIKMTHVLEMADLYTSGSLLEFAGLVLGSSLEERVSLLNRFYGSKEVALKNIHQLQGKKQEYIEKNNVSNRRQSGQGHSSGKPKHVNMGVCDKSIDALTIKRRLSSDSENKFDVSVDHPKHKNQDSGRKNSPITRKHAPAKSLHRRYGIPERQGRRHCPVSPSYFVNDEKLDITEHAEEKTNPEDESEADPRDLLDEISKPSEENDDEQKSATAKQDNVSSVLDIFNDADDRSKHRRKPPPKTTKVSPVKRIYDKENENEASVRNKNKSEKDRVPSQKDSSDDPFKVIDEIFGFTDSKVSRGKSENNNSVEKHSAEEQLQKITEKDSADSEPEIHLEENTLRKGFIDVFDDPRLWKKRKREKESDKKNFVDRLIADSEADFNDLFTSGKLRKKDAEQNSIPNKEETSKPHSAFDASASLF